MPSKRPTRRVSSGPQSSPSSREIPINWQPNDEVPIIYATHMVVQHTESEFVLSLLRVLPPMVVGSAEEELRKNYMNIKTVRGSILARVVVTADRMPGVVKALQQNLSTYEEQFGSFVVEEEEKK